MLVVDRQGQHTVGGAAQHRRRGITAQSLVAPSLGLQTRAAAAVVTASLTVDPTGEAERPHARKARQGAFVLIAVVVVVAVLDDSLLMLSQEKILEHARRYSKHQIARPPVAENKQTTHRSFFSFPLPSTFLSIVGRPTKSFHLHLPHLLLRPRTSTLTTISAKASQEQTPQQQRRK